MTDRSHSLTDAAAGPFAGLGAALWDNLTGLLGPGSRFYLPYLLVTIAIAIVAYFLNRRHMDEARDKSLLAYLFDPKVYFHGSSLVDLKVVIANRLFTPFLITASSAATIFAAYEVARFFVGAEAIEAGGSMSPGLPALVLLTLTATMASDFTSYWVHRIHHENAIFWPFHKVHHSAETLTPLTFARKHPVYDLIRALSNAFLVGPVQGLVFAMFGVSDILTILGVNAVYAVFYWSGANLRHSHVWLSYGPFFSRIFISPAQHQIHHSCAPRHHDKNYGEIFALWDWMFGTLYLPKSYEALEFGVADKEGRRLPQPHPTLKAAWLVPFQECGEALSDRKPITPLPSSAHSRESGNPKGAV